LRCTIAALDPRYVRREDVTPEMLEKEREIVQGAGFLATGKPETVVERIERQMRSFYEENCLLRTSTVIKDRERVRSSEMVNSAIAKLGRKHHDSPLFALQGR